MNRSFTLLIALAALQATPLFAAPADGPPLIRLRASTFDPAGPRAKSLSATTPTRYYLVQCGGPVQPGWKAALAGTGATIFDYVPDHTFVVRIPLEASSKVGQLPFVRALTPYLPEYRISPKLSKATGSVSASVSLFPDVDAAAFVGFTRSHGLEGKKTGASLVTVTGDAVAVRGLAQEEGVRWIEPRPRVKMLNDKTRPVLGADKVWSNHGLFGEGQIVGIFDTGLDRGDPETIHQDFAGRVVAGMGLNDLSDWADRFGHGTHVAGIIAGNGYQSASKPATHVYGRSYAGIAPEAKLVIQEVDVIEDGTSTGFDDETDLYPLMQWAYDQGARLHNNSWGDDNGEQNAYTLHAQQIDQFIWDHPDFAMFFASGNEGMDGIESDEQGLELLLSGEDPSEYGDGVVDPGSLSTPATAKNVVTVGASEGDRPSGPQTATYPYMFIMFRFQVDPIANDFLSDNIDGMAAFSSRGPTLDGRIKPDLVAPGTNILSTRSSVSGDTVYWETFNNYYAYAGGTSMSTPFAVGSAALVGEWLQKKRNQPNPSAALIKALMMNTAYDMTPGQYGEDGEPEVPPRPNSIEGWGRVDLANALTPTDPQATLFADEKAGLATGEKKQFKFNVKEGPLFAATLVWSDFPSTPTAEKNLVNDLDLKVIGPDGKELLGNGETDRVNNVEGVDLHDPQPGVYTVEVSGFNIPEGPQPFALAVSGPVTAEGGEEPAPLAGDVNLDNSVNTQDAVLTLQSIVGMATLTARQKTAADLAPAPAPDGSVDVNDAIMILKKSIGLE